MNRAISLVLRYGVLICALLLGTGLVLQLLHPTTQTLITELSKGHLVSEIPSDPKAHMFISLGILCLISLPIIRVGMTFLLFCLKRDFTYIAITLWVFLVLIFSLFSGKNL